MLLIALIGVGLIRTSFASLFCTRCKESDQGGRCILDKGIAVIQARENETARAEVVSTERSRRIY